MDPLKIAVAQFQPRDGDKAYNFSVMEDLIQKAQTQGAEVISFHEMCITAYTFTKDLSREAMLDLAEGVPDGPSVQRLIQLSRKYSMPILAGLVEKEDDRIYNTYVCVDENGLVARYRKIHPFISQYMSAGNEYVVFDLKGWKCGILICYDNNVIENVRATALSGAEIIFAPHVTGCTPSAMPGRGYVDDALWQNREVDPVSLRMEFDGPKGRGWILRWLPARAYDNGVYYVFTNPIGYDGEHLKNGNSLILDPYGEVLTEVRSFGDDIAIAALTRDKLTLAGGHRYRKARRPELYRDILGQEHRSETKPVWMKKD
ncbi:nitrilase family protein [Flavilitoribacter nigricans]|uniref:Nitrilase n=1 Tax=Flavilitoribacter nigricans (strain ATCC 23147 / DSM 23189 / NBRC 102662 / NCIMB 1420 / SS-2) TaxID=1122177 RepID=A0A2D0N9D5_FLAN2|nr:nitrilase family protein [Flavilitoribacter nigricans]PHN04986.1 nitrilase [Flavilitoribacter nigricans DSM 23189 = NBRC 102662]